MAFLFWHQLLYPIQCDLDDYVRFPTMEEVLREYVRELNVRKRKDEFALSMVTRPDGITTIIKNPAIFIDGVPAFDSGNKVTHYDPLRIKTIKIVIDDYYYGPARFNGIASFTTYKGNLEGYTPDPYSTIIDYSASPLTAGDKVMLLFQYNKSLKSGRRDDFCSGV